MKKNNKLKKEAQIIEKEFESSNILKKDIKTIEKEFGLIERKIWNFVFHFQYRKILTLVILIILTYIIFRNPNVQNFVSSLGELEYIGVFIAGIFFTMGFTTPLAVGFFVVLNPTNHLLVGVIGGMGAVVGDLIIFSLIRFSFMDEFNRLKKTIIIKTIRNQMKIHLSHRVRLYILYALAGFIIASPIPDETGVIMLAGLSNIKPKIMIVISFIFNSLGILVMSFI